MSDYISRRAILDNIDEWSKRISCENSIQGALAEFTYMIANEPTAFDLESVIMELEGISKDMQSEANDLASIGDYGCATKFEGMAQAYKDCVNILKSAANATNGKNGG